jgi:hypothetical protein
MKDQVSASSRVLDQYRLEIVPATTPMRLVDEGDGVAAVADADMPVLTADIVRETLERVRR